MIAQAHKEGVKTLRVHALLDGRDVPPTSALEYFEPLEKYLAEFTDVDYQIASGGGRMYITMDRYGADWSMVERGWHAHVLADGRQFASATEAINTYRTENAGLLDQDMHEFVVAKGGKPVGPIVDGDTVIFFWVDGDVNRLVFIDCCARHEVFAQNPEFRTSIHLVCGFLDFRAWQFVDEFFSQNGAGFEGVAFDGLVVHQGSWDSFTITFCSQAHWVDTSDDQVIDDALGAFLRKDVVAFFGVAGIGV